MAVMDVTHTPSFQSNLIYLRFVFIWCERHGIVSDSIEANSGVAHAGANSERAQNWLCLCL